MAGRIRQGRRSFNFDRNHVSRLLGSCDIEFVTNDGNKVYEATHPSSVAEAIVRSLLWGRSVFSVSSNPKTMDQALTQFLKWVAQIENDIATAIAESALGTGYEDAPAARNLYPSWHTSAFGGHDNARSNRVCFPIVAGEHFSAAPRPQSRIPEQRRRPKFKNPATFMLFCGPTWILARQRELR
jgi:hypothetical protein